MDEHFDDLLDGCDEIAKFINRSVNRTRRLINANVIPVGQTGRRGRYIASKKLVREALLKAAGGHGEAA